MYCSESEGYSGGRSITCVSGTFAACLCVLTLIKIDENVCFYFNKDSSGSPFMILQVENQSTQNHVIMLSVGLDDILKFLN